jgi:hypothetical protein
MKQYIGFIRDHSLSMTSLRDAARQDYNAVIGSFKSAAKNSSIDTIASTIKCGIGPGKGRVEREIVNSNIQVLEPIGYYETNGHSTPLFDSVGEMINLFKEVPDYHSKDVSFLIMAVTDGEDNDSPGWKYSIAHEIKKLQGTDRWTFTFRVPQGYKSYLIRLGIPEGNIYEWEQTEQGMRESTYATQSATQSYYDTLQTRGVHSNSTFYSNLQGGKQQVKAVLHSIAKEASVYPNTVREGASIKELSTHYTGKYVKGTVFYQLMKRESRIQDYKVICVQEKNSRNIYSGRAARDLLGLPHIGTIAVAPGNHGDYEIFVQSTSVNRKIPLGSRILVWMNVRNM